MKITYSQLIISLTLILSCSSPLLCQYVVDSTPYSLAAESLKKDFDTIAHGGSSLRLWQYGLSEFSADNITYTDKDSSIISVRNINYTNLQLDTEQSEVVVSQETLWNIWLTGKNLNLALQFEFEYNSTLTDFSQASFVLTFNNFYIFINEDLKVTINTNEVQFVVNNVADSGLNKAIQNALKSDKNLITKLHDIMAEGVKKWFANKYTQIQPIIFETSFPAAYIFIDFVGYTGLCRAVDDVVVCPYSASVNSHLEKNLIEQANYYDNFVKNTDEYKLFIHYNLINDIFLNLTDKNYFNFTMTESNKPAHLPYNLNIQSLGQLFPQVYELYSRGSGLKYTNIINQINISNQNNEEKATGKLSLTTTIFLEEENVDVVSFSYDITFSVKVEAVGAKVNLCMDDINVISKIKILNGLRLSSINMLRSWILTTFSHHLYKNNYCLAKDDSLNLNRYFKYITSTVQGRYGVYLIGKSLYQGVIESAKYKLGFLQ